MKRLNLALALAAAALLALSGIAVAKERGGDDGGHHGRHHHHREFGMREAGKIASFDATTGKLTIALANGESVSGLVTGATEIKCEGVEDRLGRRDHGGGDDNGGQAEPGDDHGGQNEPGDDNAGEAPAAPPACSTAALTVGEIVGEAELRLESGAAVFEEIELGFHS